MSAYWLLVPVFLMCVAGSWLSYSDAARRSPGYVWWMVLLGGACAGLFGWAARALDDKAKLYAFSLFYDSLMMAAYYLLPLALFGARVSPGVLCGAALVAVGLLVVRVSE